WPPSWARLASSARVIRLRSTGRGAQSTWTMSRPTGAAGLRQAHDLLSDGAEVGDHAQPVDPGGSRSSCQCLPAPFQMVIAPVPCARHFPPYEPAAQIEDLHLARR